MAYFHISMQHIRLPGHRSVCPLCHDEPAQEGWVMGIPGLNLSKINSVAFNSKEYVEAYLSYCPMCDFGYFFPTPSEEFLREFYLEGGGAGAGPSDQDRLIELNKYSFTENINQIVSYMRLGGVDFSSSTTKRILEIGPGFSPCAQAFCDFGMEYWASEIGAESCEFLKRNFGQNVISGPLNEIPPHLDGYFDLIFSKDSFEHHPNPLASVDTCRRLLRSGGHLAITVPNLHSMSLKKTSIMHPYFAFPPHLNYFTKNAFNKIFSQLGMSVTFINNFSFEGENYYCGEAGIKLGFNAPDAKLLDELHDSDGLERLFVVARKE